MHPKWRKTATQLAAWIVNRATRQRGKGGEEKPRHRLKFFFWNSCQALKNNNKNNVSLVAKLEFKDQRSCMWMGDIRRYLDLPGTLKPPSFKWMAMVISNHFLCKDLVHHPTDFQPLINGWPSGSRYCLKNGVWCSYQSPLYRVSFPRRKTQRWLEQAPVTKGEFQYPKLVGGFNPSEKY